MADIFISYKREDKAIAERLSIALEQLGFDVWWDLNLISGQPYRGAIRAVIDQCKAAIVMWSTNSVESEFVMDEASYAHRLGKLCPTRIDGVELPMGFGQTHTVDLSDWNGELSHTDFQSLVRAVEDRVGRKGKLGSGRRTPEAEAGAAELEAFSRARNMPAMHRRCRRSCSISHAACSPISSAASSRPWPPTSASLSAQAAGKPIRLRPRPSTNPRGPRPRPRGSLKPLPRLRRKICLGRLSLAGRRLLPSSP
jgi:hypothetical protein